MAVADATRRNCATTTSTAAARKKEDTAAAAASASAALPPFIGKIPDKSPEGEPLRGAREGEGGKPDRGAFIELLSSFDFVRSARAAEEGKKPAAAAAAQDG